MPYKRKLKNGTMKIIMDYNGLVGIPVPCRSMIVKSYETQ